MGDWLSGADVQAIAMFTRIQIHNTIVWLLHFWFFSLRHLHETISNQFRNNFEKNHTHYIHEFEINQIKLRNNCKCIKGFVMNIISRICQQIKEIPTTPNLYCHKKFSTAKKNNSNISNNNNNSYRLRWCARNNFRAKLKFSHRSNI